MSEQLPVVKGTLGALVLKSLSAGPLHGFEVVTWLEARSDGALDVEDSAIYQALYRLEQRGLGAAAWGVTRKPRRARHYQIPPGGKTWLKAQTRQWLEYTRLVSGILTSQTRTA